MKKIILFGGAFDPPHMGHLIKAQHILDMTGYDQLEFVLTYKNAWDKQMTDTPHRAEMLLTALKDFGDSRIVTNFLECAFMSGTTIDFVEELFRDIEGYGPENTVFLIGMDQANLIHEWERWEELTNLIPFFVMNRGGEEPKADWFLKPPHRMIYTNGIPMSSSKIRTQIKNNIFNNKFSDYENVKTYLTPNTYKYIKERKLYES